MMLGIQIAGEFLDLDPGTTLQLEQSNPFLQLNDEVIGQYSLPFQVLLNNKNMRLLNYAGIMQNSVSPAGVDAFIYQNGLQAGVGKVKVEKASINLNKNQKPVINCYYLSGAGGFYQDAKDKKMRDIDVGGDRTFAGGTISLAGSEFGNHVLDVMKGAIAAYDYAFYPVANAAWGDDPGVETPLMNQIAAVGFSPDDIILEGVIVPFPYLKYVLQKAIAFVGWTVDGDILTDVDFQKITMINFRAIDWGYYKFGPSAGLYMHDTVTFNLQDHLPDMLISEFLIALKNRLGWWFDFDNVSRKVTIKYLKDLVTLAQKDMTTKSSPMVIKTVLTENKLYALKNNFITGGGQGVDITKVDFQGNVNKTSDLPAPVEALVAQVYLVIEENNYYICLQSDDPAIWEWQILAANIYDYLPAGYNEEITTSATTVEMVRFSDYLDLIPRVDSAGIWTGQNGETPWGIHLAFFYGLRNTKLNYPIPFASHHIYDSQGFTLAAWSLAFKALKTDNTQVGLYDIYFKAFLNMLNSAEQIEVTLYLPFIEYLDLKFSDRIIIDGVKMFVSKVNSTLPYKKEIPIEALRIP